MGDDHGPVHGAVAPPAGPASRDAAGASLWSDAWRQLRRNPLFVGPVVVIGLLTLIAVWPTLFTDLHPRDCDLARSSELPSMGHWFGFDRQGCDYYTRVVFGTRASMAVGVLVTAGAFGLAVALGSLAGYYGGVIDTLISRLADIWFGIPLVLGAIVLLAAVPRRGVWEVSLVLVLLSWPPMMRLMRSTVLATREADYIQAARALGARDGRIIVRHVLPNAIAPVLSYATVFVGVVIAAEATLSFLGAGLQLPAISWGLLLAGPPARVLLDVPHLFVFPGLFVSLTVFSFVLLGDALRDALDPRLR